MSWLPDLRGNAGAQGRAPSQFQQEKKFEDLGIWKSVADAMRFWGFFYPSNIQCQVIPRLLENPPPSVVVQSQTGTGKTMAFFVNIVQRTDYNVDCIQHLVLVPTRELAKQTVDRMKELVQKIVVQDGEKYGAEKLTIAVAVPNIVRPGTKINTHIVVGTPGTVFNLIQRKQLPINFLKSLVVDEADHMLDQQSLGDQSIRIRREIPNIDTVQIALFSATFPDNVEAWVKRFAPSAIRFTMPLEHIARDNIKQLFMDVRDEEHKFNVVSQLYQVMQVCNSIIFTKTKIAADRLARKMEDEGHKVSVLHSGMAAEERDAIIDDFRALRTRVMITTNVLSRGIDVENLTMVVNYNLPLLPNGQPDFDTYIHRVGRCGRYRRLGVSVGFIENASTWKQLNDIHNHFKMPIFMVPADSIEDMEKLVQQIVYKNQTTSEATSMAMSRHAPVYQG